LEILRRYAAMQRMLQGKAPGRAVQRIRIGPDFDRIAQLSHFQRAALHSCITQMNVVEDLTASLCRNVVFLRGVGAEPAVRLEKTPDSSAPALDPDRLADAARSVATMWLASIVWIFVPDVVLGTTLIQFATPLGMVISIMPALSPMKPLVPALLSILLAGAIHVLIMPQVSGYGQLAVLLFAATFALSHWPPASKHYLGRMTALAMFVVIMGVSNEQTYSVLTALESLFRDMGKDPGRVDPDALRARLDAAVDALDQCVAATVENADAAGFSEADEHHLYRMLGTLRGISEDLIAVAARTGAIDWDRFHEARF